MADPVGAPSPPREGMSFDTITNAGAVIQDILAGSKSLADGIADLSVVYRDFAVLKGLSPADHKAILRALDKDGLLDPSMKMIEDFGPILRGMLADPSKKARLFALEESVG